MQRYRAVYPEDFYFYAYDPADIEAARLQNVPPKRRREMFQERRLLETLADLQALHENGYRFAVLVYFLHAGEKLKDRFLHFVGQMDSKADDSETVYLFRRGGHQPGQGEYEIAQSHVRFMEVRACTGPGHDTTERGIVLGPSLRWGAFNPHTLDQLLEAARVYFSSAGW